jgi:hypothetical protein
MDTPWGGLRFHFERFGLSLARVSLPHCSAGQTMGHQYECLAQGPGDIFVIS